MEMNCPKCNYDMFSKYMSVTDGHKSKFIRIVNVHPEYSLDALNTYGWDVECICPKCKTEWVFSDSNY